MSRQDALTSDQDRERQVTPLLRSARLTRLAHTYHSGCQEFAVVHGRFYFYLLSDLITLDKPLSHYYATHFPPLSPFSIFPSPSYPLE